MPYIETYLKFPPEGFSFVAFGGVRDRGLTMLSRHDVSYTVQNTFSQFIPLNLVKSYADSVVKANRYGLTFSIDHLVLRRERWILEMSFELPFILCGSERQLAIFRRLVSRVIASPLCKALIFELQAGMSAFKQTFPGVADDKMYTIPRAALPKAAVDRTLHEKTSILFVNSGNANTIDSFYMKGGHDVVRAFLSLYRRNKNIRLVIRSRVPPNLSEWLARHPAITVVDQVISPRLMDGLWKQADIFVHPHYGNLSNSILDAMAYGLPVVTSDAWATTEIVENGVNGFTVHNPIAAENLDGALFHVADWRYRARVLGSRQDQMSEELVERLTVLIEDHRLRLRVGDNAYRSTLTGKFSLASRNSRLGPLLTSAVEGEKQT
ncbi:MAG: glycosyltransferase family 4 protein [Nitrososphaerota archaeon]|nr:glycosyltransferase family 4 protein [Nitrososphaerota archaeon]